MGCRARRPAGTLVRIALSSGGSLIASRDAPGRGAWLCRDLDTGGPAASCFEAAVARRAFHRAYRSGVTADAVAPLLASLRERAIMETFENQEKGLKQ